MFGFLKRAKTPATRTDAGVGPLYFKDGAAAFGHICKYMECPLGAAVGLALARRVEGPAVRVTAL